MDPTFFMDHPNERKIHDVPIPRMGGIAFAPMIIILGWFLFNTSGMYTWYFLGAIGFFILGAIDDFYTITWRIKLPIQVFIGLLVVFQFFPYIETVFFFGKILPFSKLILIGFFLLWFIGITNSINLIDGLDGLAGGFMLLISSAAVILGYISGNFIFTYINILFTASLLAFLHFNQKPAKFFMGDSGSLFLGFHLAVLPLLFSINLNSIASTIDITPFIFLTSYLIADTIRVFSIRANRGKHPLEPDQLHFHYQIYNQAHSHNIALTSIFIFCGIGCLLSIITLATSKMPFYLIFIYLFILAAFSFIPVISQYTINFITYLKKMFRVKKTRTNTLITFFNVKFLSYLILIYFISLIALYNQYLFHLTNFPFILLIGTILALFILQETFSGYQSANALLISIGIFQIYILSLGFFQIQIITNYSILISLMSWIRVGSMLLISIVVVSNYLLGFAARKENFWSVTDLLITFLIIGLTGIQPLGIGFPYIFCFEIGLIYFANKLWVPQYSEQLTSAQQLT